MKFNVVVLIMVLAGLVGCDRKSASQNLYLLFADSGEDSETIQTRIIVTKDYLRFDDGSGEANFILFDRKQQIIYSVARDTKQIIAISKNEINVKSPVDLKLAEVKMDDMQDAPAIEGIKPQHYQFKSGDKVCYETLSVPNLLPAYVKAMQEYNAVLAKDSMVTLNNMPGDLHETCELAKHTYAPNRHFKHGMPVWIWQEGGDRTELVDYKKDYQADKLLFEIPKGYQQFSINELRGGALLPKTDAESAK